MAFAATHIAHEKRGGSWSLEYIWIMISTMMCMVGMGVLLPRRVGSTAYLTGTLK